MLYCTYYQWGPILASGDTVENGVEKALAISLSISTSAHVLVFLCRIVTLHHGSSSPSGIPISHFPGQLKPIHSTRIPFLHLHL